MKSMATVNWLPTFSDISRHYQNIFLIQQKKDTHTGLEQSE